LEAWSTLMDLRTLQRALGGVITGGQLLCPGPEHSAADRSLSVKIDSNAPDGFVVHSFAGDDPIECKDYVRTKAGFEPFKPGGNNGKQRASDDAIERALMAAVNMSSTTDKPRVVATYSYTDAAGTLLYQVLKYEPKTFRQRRPDGNGGWIWKLDDVPRVLYRLPELLKYPDATIFITEGEKDADRVASLGHCATTVASGRWTSECVQALTGRDCIILQDKDDKRGGEPGRTKALNAATALHGTVKSIRIVLLPGLGGDINDVSDWLDQDPRRSEKLVNICFDTPVWTPDRAMALTGCVAEAMGGERCIGRCQVPKDCSATPLPTATPSPALPNPPSSSAAPDLAQMIEERAKHDSGYAIAFALLRVADHLAAIKTTRSPP
jgi:hypothetical protein